MATAIGERRKMDVHLSLPVPWFKVGRDGDPEHIRGLVRRAVLDVFEQAAGYVSPITSVHAGVSSSSRGYSVFGEPVAGHSEGGWPRVGPGAHSMSFEMQATTPEGRIFVGLAEGLIPLLAERAADADREGRFPMENIDALRGAGLLGALIPMELGGLGVTLDTRLGGRPGGFGPRGRVDRHRDQHAHGGGPLPRATMAWRTQGR